MLNYKLKFLQYKRYYHVRERTKSNLNPNKLMINETSRDSRSYVGLYNLSLVMSKDASKVKIQDN